MTRADLMVVGAVLWPDESEGPSPRVPVPGAGWDGGADEALAVIGGRIAARGPAAELEELRGTHTRVLDARGALVLPGFVDAHVHLMSGGFQLSSVDLRGVSSREGFHRRLRTFVDEAGRGQWLLGGNWEHERWGGELPDRSWVDPVAPEHPVLLARTDMHVAVANRVALERAGIDRDTPDPPGGEIQRDPATGEATGLLRERAIELVRRVVPPPSDLQRRQALQAAQAHAFRHGVTQVHDMGVMGVDDESWQALAILRAGHEEGWLRIRVRAFLPAATRERVRDLVAEEGPGDEYLRWDGVKAFVDGSLGAGTAWFHEPYEDEPGSSGGPISDLEGLRSALLEADGWGLQCAVHAIGDRANDWVLDFHRELVTRNGARDRRFRVEHAQHLSPDAAERFGRQGVVASVQPSHLVEDGCWAERRIGSARTRRAYPFRTLLAAGAPVAFGSDWTVAPMDPVAALEAAVARRTLDGCHPRGWMAEERVPPEEAIRAHTGYASWAGFLDGATGFLAPGARADLVVLSGQIPDRDGVTPAPIRVEHTVVEGEVVYSREGTDV